MFNKHLAVSIGVSTTLLGLGLTFKSTWLIILAYVVCVVALSVIHTLFRKYIKEVEDDLIYVKNVIYSYVAPFLPPTIREIFEKIIKIEMYLSQLKFREAKGEIVKVKELKERAITELEKLRR